MPLRSRPPKINLSIRAMCRYYSLNLLIMMLKKTFDITVFNFCR